MCWNTFFKIITFLSWCCIWFYMGLFGKLFKRRSKGAETTVGTVPTDEETNPRATKDLLKEWSKTLELVEKHPLSQARVINTGVLTDLTQVLGSMNEKLDNLGKLDDIMHLLIETKKQLGGADMPTAKIDAVIGGLKGLTIKDQDALKFFKSDETLTTEEFSKVSKLSRSTASSRLNKLFSFGLLEKVADGKQIVYKLK